ncbi:uncharacterized protein LOC111646536 [Seriola lalandi dorsalis]|uniref:uncharacterized protein LOC111646536 n=1 Tax=Seriola lalandi dorsalis TaxID=1841481 RepID=UPI000C6F4AF2|nr:uncharacterized protein LOC111646536 [Seriola lalandi dorsalis]
MRLVLLLLGASVSMGISNYNEEYGKIHRMRLHSKVRFITFFPKYSSDGMILWKRDDLLPSEDRRRKVMGTYYVISNLTQRDSGRYVMSDKDQRILSTTTLEVTESTRSFTRYPGRELSFTFDLEPSSCNIYYFPDQNEGLRNPTIVREGRLQEDLGHFGCGGFELLKPCGILKEFLQMSCSGRFEVRDQDDDKAFVVYLYMESLDDDEPSHLLIAIGAVLGIIFCCCCVRSCCCGKTSSEEDSSETAAVAAGPAVRYNQNDHEPVAPRPNQLSRPSRTRYPAQSPRASTGPLIHNPPTVNVPPAYSKVSAPAEQADAPTAPLYSDPAPRFELKGMTFPSVSPLSSNPTCCDVYNSDKLNLL